jgi:hypothetical protein
MKHDRRDRMANPVNRMQQEPPQTEAPATKTDSDATVYKAEAVVPDDARKVVRCPHCGAARQHQWDRYSGGAGQPYKQCRSCGLKFVFQSDGTLRLVG